MAPLVKDGPVMYCFSPGIYPDRGSYVFSASLATKDLLAATARYYRENGWKKIATITSTDATGQDGDARIAEAFGTSENSGETIVDKEHFNTSDISIAAQMTHIKASGAQAMIAWVTGTPFGTVLRAAADAGVDLPVMTSTGNLVYPQLDSYSAFIGNNVLFPASPGDAIDVLRPGPVKNAVSSYLAAFKAAGIKPDQGHTLSWDPALLVIDGFKKFGFGMTAMQLRDYLVDLKGWTGIDGVYDFTAVPQRGLSVSSVIIVRWSKDKGTWSSVSLPGAAPLSK
jgi:branched-chain amino acid transport system substrate-binding protein